jgi:serralysin
MVTTTKLFAGIDVFVGTADADYVYGYAGDDNIAGGDGNDVLYAGDGADTLLGGEGNDQLDGGLGADLLFGGNGNDTYQVDDVGDTVVELAGEGIDTVKATFSYTLGANVENLELLGTTGLTGTGNELNNSIKGTSGGDTLWGMDGNDSINAGDGNDLVMGGMGNDLLVGGNGTDTVSYVDATGAVTVSLANTGVQNTIGAGLDKILTFENLTGSDFNDTLTGDSGANRIVGGLGADSMTGGAGDDRYSVDNVGDVVVELSGEGNDLVNANIDYTLTDNVENLALFNSAISGTGNALGNVIRGNDNGNILNGKGGEDHLYGGNGADTFVIDGPGTGVDHLHDFVSGVDVIELGAGFGLSSGGIAAGEFEVGAAATSATTRFVFDTYHNLYFDADGSGAGAAVLIANTGATVISYTDIVVA